MVAAGWFVLKIHLSEKPERYQVLVVMEVAFGILAFFFFLVRSRRDQDGKAAEPL